MQEESGSNSPTAGPGLSPFNRSTSSNYSGSNAGPPPSLNQQRNSFGPMRDNYNNSSGSWDNQGGMSRMNNPNQNYNQSSASQYGQQPSYNSNVSGFNPPMPPNSGYPQSFNSMAQNQPPPPPPPPMPQQQSMMNYDMYNNSSNMPFNNNPNQPPNSNYMQPPQPSYGQNQQQNFGNNPNNFGGMSSPFNLPPPPSSSGGGYNNASSTSTPFDNSSSYGITAQNYGGGGSGGNYNSMPQQSPSRGGGGGPMRGGRG